MRTETLQTGQDRDRDEPAQLSFSRLLALADRLPAPERTVLPALIRRDPPQPLTGQRKGVVWAKIPKLAAELGCSARAVRRGVSGLIDRGILARDPENQLQYRLRYMALRIAAEGAPPCEGCGRPLDERKRTTKRYHSAACRMRALRRRQRLARRRSRRAAACDAICPLSVPLRVKPARTGGNELSSEKFPRAVARDGNCPPAVTPTVPPSQNPGVTKTDDNGRAPARECGPLNIRPDHAELRRLVSSSIQIQRLVRAHGHELVARALRVADLEYASTKTPIRNAFGLIHAMCRDLDDTKLIEHEERQRRERERRERERRLHALQERGCQICGWWQVRWDGYCEECRPDRPMESHSTSQGARESSSAVVRT